MVGGSSRYVFFGTRVRGPAMAAVLLVAGVIAAASGGSGLAGATSGAAASSGAAATSASASSRAAATSASSPASSGSCAGVPGAHHARLVVEPAAGKVVARCVGFAGKGLAALTLLKKSRIEIGTQTYSFGVAICQADDVPAHYTQCLPSGQDYWALFLSKNGRTWTSPSVGVSDITVPAGGSLGLRYDSPKGTPAPPPRPTPA